MLSHFDLDERKSSLHETNYPAQQMRPFGHKHHLALGGSILVVVSAGFLMKTCCEHSAPFVANQLSSIPYILFWVLLIELLYPPKNYKLTVIWVLVVTSLLEFSQLYQADWLNNLRRHFLVRTVIGSTFAWHDFLMYLAGSLIAFGVLSRYRRWTTAL